MSVPTPSTAIQLWCGLGDEGLEHSVDLFHLLFEGEGPAGQHPQGELGDRRHVGLAGVAEGSWRSWRSLVDGQVAQLGAELVRGGRDQAAHLVDGLGPALAGRAARQAEDPHGLDVSVSGLGRSGGVAPLGGPGCGHGVFGVGLSLAPAALAVRSVDLDDGDLAGKQVPGEPRPVAAGPFDADQLERPEASSQLSRAR